LYLRVHVCVFVGQQIFVLVIQQLAYGTQNISRHG